MTVREELKMKSTAAFQIVTRVCECCVHLICSCLYFCSYLSANGDFMKKWFSIPHGIMGFALTNGNRSGTFAHTMYTFICDVWWKCNLIAFHIWLSSINRIYSKTAYVFASRYKTVLGWEHVNIFATAHILLALIENQNTTQWIHSNEFPR